METLKVNKDQVLTAYRQTDDGGKEVLRQLFGDKIALDITDRIKSFEEACMVLGLNPDRFNPILSSDIISKGVKAFLKLEIIALALNEGWKADWEDEDQYKHYPWFNMQGGFSFDCVHCDCTASYVGSRLCYRSEDLAKYAGTQFIDLYKELFNYDGSAA